MKKIIYSIIFGGVALFSLTSIAQTIERDPEAKGNQLCIWQDANYTYYECSGSGSLCKVETRKVKRTESTPVEEGEESGGLSFN